MAPELRRIGSIGPWDVKYSPPGERIWSIGPHDVKYSTLRFFSDLVYFVNTKWALITLPKTPTKSVTN